MNEQQKTEAAKLINEAATKAVDMLGLKLCEAADEIGCEASAMTFLMVASAAFPSRVASMIAARRGSMELFDITLGMQSEMRAVAEEESRKLTALIVAAGGATEMSDALDAGADLGELIKMAAAKL